MKIVKPPPSNAEAWPPATGDDYTMSRPHVHYDQCVFVSGGEGAYTHPGHAPAEPDVPPYHSGGYAGGPPCPRCDAYIDIFCPLCGKPSGSVLKSASRTKPLAQLAHDACLLRVDPVARAEDAEQQTEQGGHATPPDEDSTLKR